MDVLSTINIICLLCDFVTERILGTNRERDIMTCRSIGADVFLGGETTITRKSERRYDSLCQGEARSTVF